jgi:PAS domain S-box-containing protein
MPDNSLQTMIAETRQRADKLARQIGESQDSPPAVLEELALALEQLQVSEEELRVQNAELIAVAEEVAEERRRYAELFDFAPDAYIVTDRDLVIREANHAAAELLNVPLRYVKGRPFTSHIVPGTGPRLQEAIKDAQSGKPARLKLDIIPRNLQPIACSIVLATSRNHRGEPVGLRILARDVSREQSLERSLREANASLEQRVAERTEELRRANEAKDEFLGLVSHEVRNPLTVIEAGINVLATRSDRIPTDKRDALLHDLMEQTNQLTEIVRNMFLLARMQLTERPQLEPLSLVSELNKAVHHFSLRFPKRVVEMSLEPGLPAVYGESSYLQQIMLNLLFNANQYAGPSPVCVGASVRDRMVEVSVSDGGPGVPEDDLPHLFDRYYRSNSAASDKKDKGSGLGLTVCARLVEAMNGTIHAGASPEGGLSVTFTLQPCLE